MKSFFSYKILFFLLLSISYSYANEGVLQYPEPAGGWEEGDCQSNQIQSPIDIPFIKDNSILIDDGSHAKIKSLIYSNIFSGAVKYDKGHKWTTDELDIGYMEIYLNETLYRYKLHSFHFHLYSEHRIQNKQYPMELHIVHKNLNKEDKENANLVIAILFDYKEDKENIFLKAINLAEEKKINGASIIDLINKNDAFYYYKGSLTTVPCTENVNWIVFKDIKSMSFEQFNKFKNWVEKSNMAYYGVGYGNARGPKRLNGRKIYVENFKEQMATDGKYWFCALPIATFLMYPILIFYYHISIKK
jgi:carbonic anhydrase